MFFVSVDSKILRVSVSLSFSTLTREIARIDSKGVAWGREIRSAGPEARPYLIGPPLITKGYYVERIIKGQEKVEGQEKSGTWGMEG